MKIKLKGKIGSICKSGSVTNISLNLSGSVLDAPVGAKEATITCTFSVKELVADQLKIGSTLTVTIEEDLLEGD